MKSLLIRQVRAHRMIGLAVAFAGVFGAPLAAQSEVLWHFDSTEGDTTFGLPSNAVYLPTEGLVVIADYMATELPVLDATTGAVVRYVGREGDGPGEIRRAGQLLPSRNGDSFGVWDMARRTVEVFDASFEPVTRIPVGGIYGPRGGVLISDSTAVVSGGRLIAEGKLASMVWASGGRQVTGGPPAPDRGSGGGMERLHAQLQVIGGPIAFASRGLVMADAASGDVWRVTADGQQRVASGPGITPDLLDRYWRTVTVDGLEGKQAWTTFPKAIFLEAESGGKSYILGWSEEQGFTFYRLRGNQEPERLAVLEMFVYEVVRIDEDEFLIMSYAEPGEYRIERRRVQLGG